MITRNARITTGDRFERTFIHVAQSYFLDCKLRGLFHFELPGLKTENYTTNAPFFFARKIIFLGKIHDKAGHHEPGCCKVEAAMFSQRGVT